MATIKTCTRCSGKGYGTWVVVHNGAPGTCYKCDGSGKVKHFTMAERVELYVARCHKHLAQLEKEAAATKACHAARQASHNARAATRGKAPRQLREPHELDRLRATWVEVNRLMKAAATTGKVTATQQAAHGPA